MCKIQPNSEQNDFLIILLNYERLGLNGLLMYGYGTANMARHEYWTEDGMAKILDRSDHPTTCKKKTNKKWFRSIIQDSNTFYGYKITTGLSGQTLILALSSIHSALLRKQKDDCQF